MSLPKPDPIGLIFSILQTFAAMYIVVMLDALLGAFLLGISIITMGREAMDYRSQVDYYNKHS